MKSLLLIICFVVVFLEKSHTQYIHIQNAVVNIGQQPPSIFFALKYGHYLVDRIVHTSLNDTLNTQIIGVYFKKEYCLENQDIRYVDSIYPFNAVFPFSLKLYGILDSSINCPVFPVAPIYQDSFIITAAQIISLPISFTYINAEAANKKVALKWGVAQQENTDKYIVERANKEQRFVEQAQVPPTALSQYQYTDEKPMAEESYYRIKAVNKDGTFIYSKTILVKVGKQQPGIVVAPNPVRNKQLNVYTNNLVPGGYWLQLFSVEGKLLFSKKLAISNGSSTHLVELPATISKGNYVLKVQSVNDMNVLQQLVFVE